MCFKNNIDEVLRQLPNCGNAIEMRRLLEEANPCTVCPDEKQTARGKASDCNCRHIRRVEIKKLIDSI